MPRVETYDQAGKLLSVRDEPDREPAAIVPATVTETQFMRAAVKIGMVTTDEAEAYLARGELPAFVSAALAMLPDEFRADARLKAVGAANFSRSDSVFAALIAGGAATAEQVDQLFILAAAQE